MLGTVWAIPMSGGRARVWSSAPELASTGFLGANGIKVYGGDVWVSNTDKGTLLRIPLRHARPGPVQVRVDGLEGIDDFAFTGAGDVIAALDLQNTVVRIGRHGHVIPFLDTADGVRNPPVGGRPRPYRLRTELRVLRHRSQPGARHSAAPLNAYDGFEVTMG
ncbi:hypothetical protein ACFV23_19115 [Streptomyces sp. NPDC059627]